MLTFGIGAALPMLLIGTLSRQSMSRWRGKMMTTGSLLKKAMGLMLIFIGGLILSGTDKYLEAWLVEISPQWLTNFTTGF
jgi:L-asparagine transporter-like permease